MVKLINPSSITSCRSSGRISRHQSTGPTSASFQNLGRNNPSQTTHTPSGETLATGARFYPVNFLFNNPPPMLWGELETTCWCSGPEINHPAGSSFVNLQLHCTRSCSDVSHLGHGSWEQILLAGHRNSRWDVEIRPCGPRKASCPQIPCKFNW